MYQTPCIVLYMHSTQQHSEGDSIIVLILQEMKLRL